MINRADFDNITDPWQYLNLVRQLDVADRPQLLDHWLELVNQRPRAEQDTLVAHGREVFGYRVDTVRDALKQMKYRDAGAVIVAPCVHEGVDPDVAGFLAEMIYNPRQDPPYAYLVQQFDQRDAPLEPVARLQVGKKTYQPPISPLVEQGVVMVPSGIEEYIDEATLFHDLESFLSHYVQLGDNEDGYRFRRLLCCYVLLTWVYDRFTVLPYLRVLGDLGSGKSRLLQAVGWLCYRAAAASGAVTVPSVFRTTHKYRGTLIIDEADFSARSELWQEMIKVLNTGYQVGFPVWRMEREREDGKFDAQVYVCFGPKLLATRRRFSDTALESRCLTHTMPHIAELRDDVPLALGRKFFVEAAKLRNKLLLWRLRWWAQIDAEQEQRIKGVEPRVNQIIQPLLAIGNEQLQRIVLALVDDYVKQVRQERRESVEGTVVAALLQFWTRQRRPDRMLMKSITQVIREEFGLQDIKDRKVGDILGGLNVEKEARGGITWVKMTLELARGLGERFGLRLEDYELVAGLPAAPSGPALPQPPPLPSGGA